ncbi:MAG: phenylalanine--tRNA ligase subunit beta [Clostridia bacterium]|nr:phenylalanine--tRNA ligase subunit beta [Clostridia bacterium]
MKAPMGWIMEYTDISCGIKEFCDAMTMSGSKVEGWETTGREISGVVTGRITGIAPHPDADKLLLVKVDVGTETIQVVTGARNVNEGDNVPVALHGSTLPGGVRITRGKLRGEVSEGMLCSLPELQLTSADYPGAVEDGIFILKDDVEPGQDIKKVLGLGEDVVEFEITSNRPDCLSVIGLAREAAVTFGKELHVRKPKPAELAGVDVNDLISIAIEDYSLCPRYSARVATDVRIGPSPEWMRRRLRDAGVRPINNIVDITNYVMLEYGQPMHAFDLDHIKGAKIIVRSATDGEIMETLDGQPRKLDGSMLVIADAERPVAVAGVMGGADSEISESTRNILFESANFNGTSVRLTAKKLAMRTESSGRFEKGLDINNTIPAVDRACELVEQMGAGKVARGTVDVYGALPKVGEIELRPARINAFLGTDIPRTEMERILLALEFTISGSMITPPSFRKDIESEADIAEEIARFHGYNNIKATMHTGDEITRGGKSYKQKLRDIIEGACLSSGMYEAYTFSFTSPGIFDRLGLKEDDPLRNAVAIRNPLGEDYSIMRTTTLPDMIKVASHNSNRNVDKAAFYEMSYTYHPLEGSELPDEKTVITMGMYGGVDFYDIKGVTEEILAVLGITGVEYRPVSDNPFFHPGRCATILKDGRQAGIIGQVHPSLCGGFEVPADLVMGTMDVNLLYDLADLDRRYRELPKYPAMARDIAVLVDDDVTAGEIMTGIRGSAGKNLESVEFFDMYKGAQTGEGKKSLAFSLVYRAPDRTLTEDEVNASFDKVVRMLAESVGAELRQV